jgi:hypothetical protein
MSECLCSLAVRLLCELMAPTLTFDAFPKLLFDTLRDEGLQVLETCGGSTGPILTEDMNFWNFKELWEY